MIGNYYYGTGRRKTSVARVFLKTGTGKFIVNEKSVDEFFSRDTGRMVVRQPLVLTNHEQTFDIMVNVTGGGESGPGGRSPARHHPRADRLRCATQAHAVQGGPGDARRAGSRAEEGRPAQGPTPQAVQQALTGSVRVREARKGRREAALVVWPSGVEALERQRSARVAAYRRPNQIGC